MLARTGRPKIDNPRNIKITFRVNSYENAMLEEICGITGKNKNEVLRNAVKMYFKYLKQGE